LMKTWVIKIIYLPIPKVLVVLSLCTLETCLSIFKKTKYQKCFKTLDKLKKFLSSETKKLDVPEALLLFKCLTPML